MKIKISTRVIVITSLAIIASSGIYFYEKQNRELESQQSKALPAKAFNIALVNEDQGAEQNGTHFNIGQSYVKKIEKDNENNWFVVSQGIGDSGLKNGQYQLLIKIPTDFSSKILDIDKERPESLDVSYQINNNGDTRITTLASAKGNEIIKDLEQSLINVYFASILSNFHTAQNNIEKVGDVQLANVTSYNKDIYTGVNQVKSSLPRLIDISKGSSEGNTRLTDSLDSFTTGLDGFITSQDDHDSQLQKLLQKNSEVLIRYGQFSDEIVGLRADVSSEGPKKD